MVEINLSIKVPEQVEESNKHKSLEEKVDEYMLMVESDSEDIYHWTYLKQLYKKLCKLKKIKKEYKPLLKKLEEFVMKHRGYDSEDYLDIDGQDMFKHVNDDGDNNDG